MLRLWCPGPIGSCSLLCPVGVLCCVFSVLGLLTPFHRCARSVRCVACAVSWASWLLFKGVPFPCVVLCVRCRGPLGSCSLVCPCEVVCSVCAVLGHLAPLHRCARPRCCVACGVSWPTLLLFNGVPARCVVLRVRFPWPLGSCSQVCLLEMWCCLCGVLGHLGPVHGCAHMVPCLHVLSLGPLGFCSPLCPPEVLCCVCAVLGH